jgi:uncharacterized membrane protein YdjX (TVP38/TMEM64 family)
VDLDSPDAATITSAEKHGTRWGRIAILALFVAAVAAFFLLGGQRWLSLDALRANAERLRGYTADHYAAMLVASVLVYAAATAVNVPAGAVLTLAVGFLFGRWVGTAAVVVGATAGATLAFLGARYVFADAARRRAGPFAQRMLAGFRDNAFSYLLFLRLVPLFPFWLVNLVPALTPIRVRTFVAATAIGIIPGTFAFANAGSALASIRSTRDILGTSTLLAFGLLGVLALVPVLVQKLRSPKPGIAP